MILINNKKVKHWLEVMGRNQFWLAKKIGVSKSFMSQILNNKCKIPPIIIERFLLLGFRFEDLFHYDGEKDERQFLMASIIHEDEIISSDIYKRKINKILKD